MNFIRGFERIRIDELKQSGKRLVEVGKVREPSNNAEGSLEESDSSDGFAGSSIHSMNRIRQQPAHNHVYGKAGMRLKISQREGLIHYHANFNVGQLP